MERTTPDGSRYSDDELLALSGIQHFAFCERQWALMQLEGLWDDNFDTITGDIFHKRAHLEGYETIAGVVAVRSMRLTSYALGMYGISDVVEFMPSDKGKPCLRNILGDERCMPTPIEYKKGSPKAGPHDRLQLAAQVLCLEEMYDLSIPAGFLFYGQTRRRERVEIDDRIRQDVYDYAQCMHQLVSEGITPPPVHKKKCDRCSLKTACMPELAGKIGSDYWQNAGFSWDG